MAAERPVGKATASKVLRPFPVTPHRYVVGMRPHVPQGLLDRAGEWDDLHRWERSELGKDLCRLGLTYCEIRDLIPVPKGTLSYWCRDIRLSEAQIGEIRARTGPASRRGVPVNTQWKRREEVTRMRAEAQDFASNHLDDPFFVAGVALYWGEGSKTHTDLALANSDPRALRLFITWVRSFHTPNADFVLKINLHAGNDELGARAFWREETGLPDADFHRTFVKPEGTGHRKNHLPFGVCQVRVRRCTDHWIRTMVWVDTVAAARWGLMAPAR